MAAQARKPALQVVREGNPGKRPIQHGLVLPPADLVEPDWRDAFPVTRNRDTQPVNRRAREVARREWRRVVPVLKQTAGIAAVDAQILHDYCVIVARIDQCERSISVEGLLVPGRHGTMVRNGATIVVSQYRAQLKTYIRELGLSPSARVGIVPPGDDDDDDSGVFD